MANYKNNKPGKKYSPPQKKHIPPANKSTAQSMQIKPAQNRRLDWITAIFIAICGIILYVNTSGHSFVLDDFSVIAENKMTVGGIDSVGAIFKKGYRAGNYTTEDNLYRPLTKAMFAVEYDLSGGEEYFKQNDGQPTMMHWINILLYGFLCGFIFLSLRKFFPGHYYLALITTLLFAFHPLHTEVVANIKSRDEILNLLFLIASLRSAWSYFQTNKFSFVIGAAVFYMLALLTKESAITYMALLPVSLYFFSKQTNWQKIGIVTLCMAVITGLYLALHLSVIGRLGLPQATIPTADNSLNVDGATGFQKKMTAIYCLGWYLKLMILPHPLSCDYSFNTIPLVKDAGHGGFVVALLIHVGLLAYAIWGFKKKKILSYAIFFYFITISIVSNLFTLIGTNLAERLVFMPSLAFCLGIAFLVSKLFKLDQHNPLKIGEVFVKKPLVWFLLIPVMLIGAVKIVDRNMDWKNVSTLFNKDIKTVPNSVHMLWYHANMITNEDSLILQPLPERLKTLRLAEKELLRADSILWKFPNVQNSLGKVYKSMAEIYKENGKVQDAINLYQRGLFHYKRNLLMNDADPTTYNNLATCYFSIGVYDPSGAYFDSARVNFTTAIQKSPLCYADGLANLGSVYGMMGAAAQQKKQYDLSVQYFNKAIEQFNKTLECDPNNIQAYQFLGVTYNNLGDTARGRPYTQKYLELLKRKNDRLMKIKQ
jgi:tetratricopeptide (TPR) repeat protein